MDVFFFLGGQFLLKLSWIIFWCSVHPFVITGVWKCVLRICQKYEKLIRPTLPETDIAAEIQWLEDEMSFWKLPIFRGYVSFREGSFGMVWVVIFPPESQFSEDFQCGKPIFPAVFGYGARSGLESAKGQPAT